MEHAIQEFLTTLNLVAAVNGALVGSVLLIQERFGPVRTRVTLACFLIVISALLYLFVLLDSHKVVFSQPLGVAMDAAALLSGALLFDYVYSSVSPRGPAFWPYLMVVAYLIATAVNGERLLQPAELAPVVAMGILFSILAFFAYLRARSTLPAGWKHRPEYRRLPVLLSGLAVFHVAQILRIAAPQERFFFDLVPFLGSVGLLAFTIYGLIGSQTLRTLAAVSRTAAAEDDLGVLLDKVMETERAYLDPDLSLPRAAALLGITPARLSAHLNRERGVTFRTYVNSLRISESKRLLRSPQESRTSVEAIAMMSGFRSRSSFYTAFQAQVDTSPQAYRESGGSQD